ncbi:WSC domain-containing protein [Pochonia chlamydosporia 170]|uniref:WSC domain-containing protein n=1 Tax=Pochonia chlamydosporia 170 TaxID=1380566 RepID=A0A179FQB5_METCM|nr:WSC domain-containing protein [Pochonia chlamydosporia 170]OAQ67263.1 WSC domain-containing protein [Pochonia chlamydosporia 170]
MKPSSGKPSSTKSMPSKPASSGKPKPSFPPQPPFVGPFRYLSCYKSTRGFPTFKRIASSPRMSLDLCASSCDSPLFGVFNNDCFCGQRLDGSDFRVDERKCDIICPGNMRQRCGGLDRPGLRPRDDIPADWLLSIYERRGGNPTTTSKVITSTKVITITSCPPAVTDCPIGHKITKTWTATVPWSHGWEWEWHKKKVTCYGDYCVSGYHCDECERHRVVYDGGSYQCEASSDPNWHRMVHCDGGKCYYSKCHGDGCNKKVVCWDGQCTSEVCYGDECKKKLVCHDGRCEHQSCHGDDCHKKWVCKDGKCTVDPGCTGDCMAPPPGKKIVPGGSSSGSSGWSDPGKSGSHGWSDKGKSGSQGWSDPGKPGSGSSGWSDPGKSGSSGWSDPGKHGQDGDSGNRGGKGGSGNQGEYGHDGHKPGPAHIKTAVPPKNTSPVAAGSNKGMVTFNLLAAAVGLAFLM